MSLIAKYNLSPCDARAFFTAYFNLSIEGACDLPSSTEQERILAEWVEAGKPQDVEVFIRISANRYLEELNTSDGVFDRRR